MKIMALLGLVVVTALLVLGLYVATRFYLDAIAKDKDDERE